MGLLCSTDDSTSFASNSQVALLTESVETRKRNSEVALATHRRAINELLLGWLIQKEEIEYRCEIGRGGFGAVHLARYRNMDVAVKKMYPTPMEDFGLFDYDDDDGDDANTTSRVSKVTVKMLQQMEVGMMMRLRHPRLVAFLGAGELTEPTRGIFVVLEYVDGGDLATRLKRSREDHEKVSANSASQAETSFASTFTWKSRLQCACDIAEGMHYIHSKGRVHRDLKSMNVLCDAAGRAKIADLGLATSIECYGSKSDMIKFSAKRDKLESSGSKEDCNGVPHVQDATAWTGTSSWMAPEITFVDQKTKKATYGNAVDVYSFGVVMWEIMTKRLPWRDENLKFDHEILKLVKEGRRPEATKKEIDSSPEGWVELMWKCWAGDPSYRPTFKHIKEILDDMLVRYSREIVQLDENVLKKEMKMLLNEVDHLVKKKMYHEAARVYDKYLVVEKTMNEAKCARLKREKTKKMRRKEWRHTIVKQNKNDLNVHEV
jgi:serine/threonine protein kinase